MAPYRPRAIIFAANPSGFACSPSFDYAGFEERADFTPAVVIFVLRTI